jgi:hypothetical protein
MHEVDDAWNIIGVHVHGQGIGCGQDLGHRITGDGGKTVVSGDSTAFFPHHKRWARWA